MVPQLKIAPLFRVVSSTFPKILPLFRMVSSTFSEILTPILHENRYNLARKRTPIFCISSTLLLTHPFFNQIKNRQKLTFSSTRSKNIFTPFFKFRVHAHGKFSPLFFKFRVHAQEINPFLQILRTLYVREHSFFFAKFGTIMHTQCSMKVTRGYGHAMVYCLVQ